MELVACFCKTGQKTVGNVYCGVCMSRVQKTSAKGGCQAGRSSPWMPQGGRAPPRCLQETAAVPSVVWLWHGALPCKQTLQYTNILDSRYAHAIPEVACKSQCAVDGLALVLASSAYEQTLLPFSCSDRVQALMHVIVEPTLLQVTLQLVKVGQETCDAGTVVAVMSANASAHLVPRTAPHMTDDDQKRLLLAANKPKC